MIEEWGDTTPLLHNELIHHYRELVTAPIPASDPTSLEEVRFIHYSFRLQDENVHRVNLMKRVTFIHSLFLNLKLVYEKLPKGRVNLVKSPTIVPSLPL